MSLRTDVSKKYLLRLAVVGLVCLGFSGWSYYDGKYAWPEQRERALMYQELEEDLKEKQELGIDKQEDRDLATKWAVIADERGWPPTHPGEPKTEADIAVQFYMVWIAGIPGVLVLLNVIRRVGSWIELDGETLRSSAGQELKLDQITQIDKKRWDKKGIANLHYKQDGNEQKFTLDDFIFERPTTDAMLLEIEQQIGHDKIVNGKPEPLPKSEEAAAAEPVETATS